MNAVLPPYGTFVDDWFNNYDEVYVLGDLHNNETGLLQFLRYHDLIAYPEATLLANVGPIVKKVMIVFLGDAIGKMKTDNTDEYMAAINVLRFIESPKKNCMLVIGNHEMRFLARNTVVDDISNLEITNMILSRDFRVSSDRCRCNPQLKLYIQLEDIMKRWKHKRSRMMPMFSGEIIKKRYNENVWLRFIIIAFIVQFGEFMLYFQRLKTYMFHGGLDFNRDMHKQQSSNICNIRTRQYHNRKGAVPTTNGINPTKRNAATRPLFLLTIAICA